MTVIANLYLSFWFKQSARVMVSLTDASVELPARLDVSLTRMTGAVVDIAMLQEAVVVCASARPGSASTAKTPNNKTKNQSLERPTMVRLSQHVPCQRVSLL